MNRKNSQKPTFKRKSQSKIAKNHHGKVEKNMKKD